MKTRRRNCRTRRTPQTIVMQKAEKGRMLRKCIDALPFGDREILDLVYYHELVRQRGGRGAQYPGRDGQDQIIYGAQTPLRIIEEGRRGSRVAMSDESDDRDALQELELLLPFHATGRLTPSEVARVEQYFSDHPDRWQLSLKRKTPSSQAMKRSRPGKPTALPGSRPRFRQHAISR